MNPETFKLNPQNTTAPVKPKSTMSPSGLQDSAKLTGVLGRRSCTCFDTEILKDFGAAGARVWRVQGVEESKRH